MAIAIAYLLSLIFKSILLLFFMAVGVALTMAGCVPLAVGYVSSRLRLAGHEIVAFVLAAACGIALFLYAGAGLAAYIMPSGIAVP